MTDAARYTDELLDMILDGRPVAADAPRQLIVLADRLADLAGPAPAGELPGEAAALAAFSQRVRPGAPAPELSPPSRPKTGRRQTAARARLASVIAAAVVVAGGTAAAYAGVLPASVQQFAHRAIGAPTAHPAPGHERGQRHQPATSGANGAGESPDHGKAAHSHGRGQARAEHGQRARHGKPVRKARKAHPAHPVTRGTQSKG